MPAIGAYMVTKTHGWVGWAIRWITHSRVNHAGVYVGKGWLVEAQPHGARLVKIKAYPDAIWSQALDSKTGKAIARAALGLVGTPYNFLDIAAQACVRLFKWQAPEWALRRLSSPKRLQCAQLVDEAYRRAGIQLFMDGRPAGLVAPGDLYDLMEHD
jgi:hypothetical protein